MGSPHGGPQGLLETGPCGSEKAQHLPLQAVWTPGPQEWGPGGQVTRWGCPRVEFLPHLSPRSFPGQLLKGDAGHGRGQREGQQGGQAWPLG